MPIAMRIVRLVPEHYLAGFEDQDGEPWGLAVPLEPDDVEAVVLGGIVFSISVQLDGTLLIEAEGRGDAANEAILASGSLARRPLDEIVRDALDQDLMAMEDESAEELRTLRNRLASALQLVHEALRERDQ